MKIRKATLKDFDKLKEIKSEFYLLECRKDKRLKPEYVKRGLGARTAKNMRQKNRLFMIAEDKGDIVGYAGAEIIDNPAFVKQKKRGHFFNLYVRPEYQGKGIGKKLIREVLAWFRKNKIKDLMIHVYHYNKKAYSIYKKMGYEDYIIELKK